MLWIINIMDHVAVGPFATAEDAETFGARHLGEPDTWQVDPLLTAHESLEHNRS